MNYDVNPVVLGSGKPLFKGLKDMLKRVTEAFLKMKKFDIEKLKQAYEGHEIT